MGFAGKTLVLALFISLGVVTLYCFLAILAECVEELLESPVAMGVTGAALTAGAIIAWLT